MRYLFLLPAGLLLLSISSAADNRPAFVGAADCRIDNAGRKPDETAVWSGACKDGYADGVGYLQWSSDGKPGARYEGPLVRGRPDGAGAYQAANGTIFEGRFQQGLRQGTGVQLDSNGNRLTATYQRGAVTGPVDMLYASGQRYRGDWDKGSPNGYGTMTYPLGGEYVGSWQHGRPHGAGTIVYPNGIKLADTFDHGKRPGQIATPLEQEQFVLNGLDEGSMRLIRHPISTGYPAPYDRAYAELSVNQQRAIRAEYAILQDDDIAPYPIHGPKQIYTALYQLIDRLGKRGKLSADVLIDPDGKPVSVRIITTPDQETGEFAAQLLTLEKYTPARCGGLPCAMSYPLRVDLSKHF